MILMLTLWLALWAQSLRLVIGITIQHKVSQLAIEIHLDSKSPFISGQLVNAFLLEICESDLPYSISTVFINNRNVDGLMIGSENFVGKATKCLAQVGLHTIPIVANARDIWRQIDNAETYFVDYRIRIEINFSYYSSGDNNVRGGQHECSPNELDVFFRLGFWRESAIQGNLSRSVMRKLPFDFTTASATSTQTGIVSNSLLSLLDDYILDLPVHTHPIMMSPMIVIDVSSSCSSLSSCDRGDNNGSSDQVQMHQEHSSNSIDDKMLLYHTTEVGCRLWWPLNHSELFVYSISDVAREFHETLIIDCSHLNSNNRTDIVIRQLLVEDLDTGIIYSVDVTCQENRDKHHVKPLQLEYPVIVSRSSASNRLKRLALSFFYHDNYNSIDNIDVPYRRNESILIHLQIVTPTNNSQASNLNSIESYIAPAMMSMVNGISNRNEWGYALSMLSPTAVSMVEIGVNRGEFAELIFSTWSPDSSTDRESQVSYTMVDLWMPITTDMKSAMPQSVHESVHESVHDMVHENEYVDANNLKENRRSYETNFKEAMKRIERFVDIDPQYAKIQLIVLRMNSEQAAQRTLDASLGVVYIDARHDYAHVLQDLYLWWPKLIRGGLLAGHDFAIGYSYDTIFTVKPAVEKFARDNQRVLYHTNDPTLPTWFIFR